MIEPATGIAALAEPTRRALYDYVAGQDGPVGREQVAAAVRVAPHTAKFHLDRLVQDGLLEVQFRRLTGRQGPGAGRPAKLYSRSSRQFAVSLPERRYDLVGQILADAVGRTQQGAPLADALHTCARQHGQRVGAQVGPQAPVGGEDLGWLAAALAAQGYEPRVTDQQMTLANCPFHALAQQHTDLICGLNQVYVQGIADGMACSVRATLTPWAGHCCVSVRRETPLEKQG